jgi:hypothetical protein
MKKIISLFIAFALLVSCQKDNNGNQGNGKIAIKGTIPGKSQKKSAEISSLTDAKKVLIIVLLILLMVVLLLPDKLGLELL